MSLVCAPYFLFTAHFLHIRYNGENMSEIRIALKMLLILAIAALLAGPAIAAAAGAQWTAGGQYVNAPAAQGIMPGSQGIYTQQPAGLLPPEGPYACPYGYYLDPVTRQCVPVPPWYPGSPRPMPYGQLYDPRVV